MKYAIALISLLFSGAALADGKEGLEQTLPPIAEGHEQGQPPRPPLVEACFVEGCNGVEVLNKAPIPVEVRGARRVPLHRTFGGLVPANGMFCGHQDLGPHPFRLETVSARLFGRGAGLAGLAMITHDPQPGVRPEGYLPTHFVPLQNTGHGTAVGTAPVAMWVTGGRLSVCVGEAEGTGYVTFSGYYEVPAGAPVPPIE